ncbi:hypothetical protein RJ640_006635 [Escallonia rubra]|uniref:PUM-HD domain-containing protein n=1 Tax=Escallonia rubra TaxID=112253 RepID=A0AA88R9L3_9ASTE|nr:hypothetical protein RJ640_006635 [Escallonia rubra]
MILSKMEGDGEIGMLLNEIPHAVTPVSHHLQNHHQTSFSGGGFCSSEGGGGLSPSFTPFHDTLWYQNYVDSASMKNNSNGNVFDEMGLSANLHKMHIGDDYEEISDIGRSGMENPGGYDFSDHYTGGFGKCYPIEGLDSGFNEYGGFQLPVHGNFRSPVDDMEATLLGFGQRYNMGDSVGPNGNGGKDLVDYLMELKREQGRGYGHRGTQFQSPFVSEPYVNDDFYCSRQFSFDPSGHRSMLNPLHSSHFLHPELGLCVGHSAYNGLVQETRPIPKSIVHPCLQSMPNAGDSGAFNPQGSFNVQARNLNYVADKGSNRLKVLKKNTGSESLNKSRQEKLTELYDGVLSDEIIENGSGLRSCSPLPLQPAYGLLTGVRDYIYLMAKDQRGCRFLQKIFDAGNLQDVQIIFNEIIGHVVELMTNPFGNYLVQKLLDICAEEQRMMIVLMVTEKPGELVRICLNTHGTRVVQKLIETLKTRQQTSLVVMALEPGFLDLMKDLNGNHVVQRCLQCLGKEHSKFIFYAAAKFCVDVATHRHGCCVLNRCISHSAGEDREKLVAEISANGLILAQNAYGNYVIQYIIELKIPSSAATLLSQFKGHFVYLSKQKFSSHVIEKCLRHFEESRSRIIHELLSVPNFDQLLQDPFANYVIQSALEVTKGHLHAALVEAVQPHTILRTSPYCKKLFSRNLLNK